MTQITQSNVIRASRIAAFALTALFLSACGGAVLDVNVKHSYADDANDTTDPIRNPGTMPDDDDGQTPIVDDDDDDAQTPIVDDDDDDGQAPIVDDDDDDGTAPVVDNEDVPAADINGYVKLEWTRPTERYNGDSMFFEEIGGYVLRHQEVGADAYSVTELGAEADEYVFDDLEGNFHFTIAVYDVNGRYSQFVDITPQN